MQECVLPLFKVVVERGVHVFRVHLEAELPDVSAEHMHGRCHSVSSSLGLSAYFLCFLSLGWLSTVCRRGVPMSRVPHFSSSAPLICFPQRTPLNMSTCFAPGSQAVRLGRLGHFFNSPGVWRQVRRWNAHVFKACDLRLHDSASATCCFPSDEEIVICTWNTSWCTGFSCTQRPREDKLKYSKRIAEKSDVGCLQEI